MAMLDKTLRSDDIFNQQTLHNIHFVKKTWTLQIMSRGGL